MPPIGLLRLASLCLLLALGLLVQVLVLALALAPSAVWWLRGITG